MTANCIEKSVHLYIEVCGDKRNLWERILYCKYLLELIICFIIQNDGDINQF